MSEQEMSENEVLFAEEKGDINTAPVSPVNLQNIGVTAGGLNSEMAELGPEGSSELGGMSGAETVGMAGEAPQSAGNTPGPI